MKKKDFLLQPTFYPSFTLARGQLLLKKFACGLNFSEKSLQDS